MLRGRKMEDMTPWYKGYAGCITPVQGEEGRYEVSGVVTKKDNTTLEITEIPIRKWTQDYKEFLEGMMPGEKKTEESAGHMIEDFREYHTENTFKLKTHVSIQNMMLFDPEGKIGKYESALDI